MTYHSATTPVVANKDADSYAPSAVTKLFSELIGRLTVAIEAERDVETANSTHPDFDSWLTEAECAWSNVTDVHLELKSAPVMRDEDMPLKVLGFVINKRMEVETPSDWLRLERFLQRNTHWMVCSGRGATARRVTLMLDQGHYLLDALGSFDLFQPLEASSGFAEDAFPAEPSGRF